MGAVATDERVGLGLAAGAGGGGNGDEREQRLRGFAVAVVIVHDAPVGEENVGGFRGVEAAAATEGDETIEGLRASGGDASGGVGFGGIFARFGEDRDGEAGGDEEGAGTFDVAGAGETGIGHKKNAGPANLTHASGQFTQRPGTKDELGCGAGGERADHGIGIGTLEIRHQESKI